MQIKVDEDLPKAVTRMLQDKGYDAIDVISQGMNGWSDAQLWKAVQSEHRFLVTADKGFGDIRFHPPGTHYGVLVLRPDQDGIRPLIKLLEQVLASCDMATLGGTIAVVTPRGIRIRREPSVV